MVKYIIRGCQWRLNGYETHLGVLGRRFCFGTVAPLCHCIVAGWWTEVWALSGGGVGGGAPICYQDPRIHMLKI